MPNLINNDAAGNTFCNYLSPLQRGESLNCFSINWGSFLDTAGITKFGFSFGYYSGSIGRGNATAYEIRFPAGSLEGKSGAITSSPSSASRIKWIPWFKDDWTGQAGFLYSGNTNNSTSIDLYSSQPDSGTPGNGIHFAVANNFSIIRATFSDSSLTNLLSFNYDGYLRDTPYNSSTTSPKGIVHITRSTAQRITSENATGLTTLSTASNSITNPSINCAVATIGANAVPVKIRDNASPNFCAGKLYNCILVPNSFTVGQVIADQNGLKYLVIMAWGSQKLAMLVWTEGYT
jgi:hypothetical protein